MKLLQFESREIKVENDRTRSRRDGRVHVHWLLCTTYTARRLSKLIRRPWLRRSPDANAPVGNRRSVVSRRPGTSLACCGTGRLQSPSPRHCSQLRLPTRLTIVTAQCSPDFHSRLSPRTMY